MPRRRIEDPRELRALAHPVRVAIMEQLGYRGPMTASQLAEHIDESPSNLSWHLRKLGEFGLVEPDPDGGSGRQKPWKTTFLAYEVGDSTLAHDLEHVVLNRQVDRFLAATAEGKAVDWAMSPLWATDAEYAVVRDKFAAFTNSVHELFDRISDPTTIPEGAKLYEMTAWITPMSEE